MNAESIFGEVAPPDAFARKKHVRFKKIIEPRFPEPRKKLYVEKTPYAANLHQHYYRAPFAFAWGDVHSCDAPVLIRKETSRLWAFEKPEVSTKEREAARAASFRDAASTDAEHLWVFRTGSTAFLLSVLSLVFWLLTHIGAPLHPVFAILTLPISIGVMGMAFLMKRQGVKNQE